MVADFSIHEIHIIDLGDGFPSMIVEHGLSFLAFDFEGFQFRSSVPAKHHLLDHDISRHRRDVSVLSLISCLEKDDICYDAEK